MECRKHEKKNPSSLNVIMSWKKGQNKHCLVAIGVIKSYLKMFINPILQIKAIYQLFIFQHNGMDCSLWNNQGGYSTWAI